VYEMRVWSLGAGGQTQAPNHCKVLRSKAVVLSVAEKAGMTRQVRPGKASANKPLTTCRKCSDDAETGEMSYSRDEVGRRSDYCPTGIRHGGGASPGQAHAWNVRTSIAMRREKTQAGGPCKDERTDARSRGGAIRSSEEGAVMALERRDRLAQPLGEANRRREELRG
jgi:hypothetical protein